jgi:ribosomal subunit interface protein
MKIDIRAVHFGLDKETRDYAAEKIGHLEKYYKNIIAAEIGITCDHEDTAGSSYSVKAKLVIPGKDLFAESGSRNINEAIDKAEDRLHQQIIKLREKNNPKHLHRAKEWVRNFFGR